MKSSCFLSSATLSSMRASIVSSTQLERILPFPTAVISQSPSCMVGAEVELVISSTAVLAA